MKYRFVRYRYWFRFVSRSWLDTDISSKNFVCLKDVLKMSSRHVFKMSSYRLQGKDFSFSKTSSKCNFKSSWRRLEDVFENKKLLQWRRVQDVFKKCLQDVFKACLQNIFKASLQDIFKTCLEDYFKASWKPTNVCWVSLMQNADLTEKSRTLENILFIFTYKNG